eukprot:TRINITY_DN19911_c0_g1_i1.p1 TRINITY_DN19911_c0_g1~~TRINITY_DN19911_c0_g1_i1.p1  ORF type:complete len:490 (-),score=56.63 TRINITY_DN19911_c0_g1_i1:300-1712(-)
MLRVLTRCTMAAAAFLLLHLLSAGAGVAAGTAGSCGAEEADELIALQAITAGAGRRLTTTKAEASLVESLLRRNLSSSATASLPDFTNVKTLMAAPGPNTKQSGPVPMFGWQVAVDGDVAYYGAPRRMNVTGNSYFFGAVYIQDLTSAVNSSLLQLNVPVIANGWDFGFGVAANNGRLVVGNPAHAEVWVFERSKGSPFALDSWKQTAHFRCSLHSCPYNNAPPSNDFGKMVAVDKSGLDAIVITDKNYSAWIYELKADSTGKKTWVQTLHFMLDVQGSLRVWSVALEGDTFVAGLYRHSTGQPAHGQARVYTRTATGQWDPNFITLHGANPNPSDNVLFGHSVDVSNGIVAVANSGSPSQASVDLFYGAGFAQVANVQHPLHATSYDFGFAVALEGGTLVAADQYKQGTYGEVIVLQNSDAQNAPQAANWKESAALGLLSQTETTLSLQANKLVVSNPRAGHALAIIAQ